MTPEQTLQCEVNCINHKLGIIDEENAKTYDIITDLLKSNREWQEQTFKGLNDALYRLSVQADEFTELARRLMDRIEELEARIQALENGFND